VAPAQRRVRQGIDSFRMQILSKQPLDEIMSVFKFFGFIANNHRFPPPNQQTREDSYSFSLYSTFSGTSRTHARIMASFRFFSKRFSHHLDSFIARDLKK
jgi:hypothetical protein